MYNYYVYPQNTVTIGRLQKYNYIKCNYYYNYNNYVYNYTQKTVTIVN